MSEGIVTHNGLNNIVRKFCLSEKKTDYCILFIDFIQNFKTVIPDRIIPESIDYSPSKLDNRIGGGIYSTSLGPDDYILGCQQSQLNGVLRKSIHIFLDN